MADDSLNLSNSADLSKLKVPDLKKELKQRGLSTSGNKTELVERLQIALKSTDGANTESIDDIEEDLLNDDDDEHLETSESVINELDNELEDSPKISKTTTKRKLESSEQTEAVNLPPKKVILNRNIIASSIETLKNPETKKEEEKLAEDDKKVVKLSELSAKERLEMRAKKFGAGGITALSDGAKKAARAERFGSSVSNGSSNHSKISMSDTASVDVLKKRAARFGQSVSSVITELEKKEALEKRKQRFGGSNASNGDYDEKAKARLERFKQPIT